MTMEVFISYRWGKESNQAVRLLVKSLEPLIGKNRIYFDVDDNSGCDDLPQHIEKNIRNARVLIVAIHPDWISDIQRLFERRDFVRLEIEMALNLGVQIVPVLLGGAKVPKAEILPGEIRALADIPMHNLGDHQNYDTDVKKLADYISQRIGSKTELAISRFADRSALNHAFGAAILGALLLFLSRLLDIHFIQIDTKIDVFIRRIKVVPQVNFIREVGVLMAWNWVVIQILVTPSMIIIANNTLREAKELLDSLRIRKMITYISTSCSGVTQSSIRHLWDVVVRPTASWCNVFVVIAMVLGAVQWWQYSGQWYFRPDGFVHKLFMETSTGPDWNIGWALGVELIADSGLRITAFSFAMYLLYGLGSAITFSYYAFLFNYFSELTQLSLRAGEQASMILRLDESDLSSGGLGALSRIQRNHAKFCYFSVFSMYIMALRNAYLPLTCRLPYSELDVTQAIEEANKSCASMISFASMVFTSSLSFTQTLFQGTPDFGLLFHTYSEHNIFVVGSMLHALLIAAFFYLISSNMQSIIDSARSDLNPSVGADLSNRIRRENMIVLTILLLGSVSTIFLNLGPIVLLLALFISISGRTRFVTRY